MIIQRVGQLNILFFISMFMHQAFEPEKKSV